MELNQIRDKHIKEVTKIYKDHNLDAILNIPVQFPAFPHELVDIIGTAPIATRLAIYWQFPAGIIPAAVVEQDEQNFNEKVFNDILTSKLRESMKDSQGLPMGLEIIGKPYQDEQVLAIMKILENCFEFRKIHPYPEF